jgi:hypothetical protein
MDELNQLLNGTTGGTSTTTTTDIANQINTVVIWTIVPTVIFAVIFLVIYILRVNRRRKVENAIFEIRDLLKTMQPPQIPAPHPQPTEQKPESI